MKPLYRLVVHILNRPMRHAMRWTVEGLEHVPQTGGALIASNHISYVDPFAMAYLTNMIKRAPLFMAKSELYSNPWMDRFMRAMGHIPVNRGAADTATLDVAADVLRSGELLGVYPEGTISNQDYNPMAGKTGVARIARASAMPVIPLGLWGTHRLLTTGHRAPLTHRVAVSGVFGPPVIVAPGDNPREATDRIMAAVCQCVRRAREIYPQGPHSPKDTWWVHSPDEVRLKSCRGRVAQEILDRTAEACFGQSMGQGPPST
jgi:1-acyl-sn-glycerol-3-phosphate acyltransferase